MTRRAVSAARTVPRRIKGHDGHDVRGGNRAERGCVLQGREVAKDAGGETPPARRRQRAGRSCSPPRAAAVASVKEGGDAVQLLLDDEKVPYGGAPRVQDDDGVARALPPRADDAREDLAASPRPSRGLERGEALRSTPRRARRRTEARARRRGRGVTSPKAT